MINMSKFRTDILCVYYTQTGFCGNLKCPFIHNDEARRQVDAKACLRIVDRDLQTGVSGQLRYPDPSEGKKQSNNGCEVIPPNPPKKKVCTWFVSTGCNNNKCTFAHDEDARRTAQAKKEAPIAAREAEVITKVPKPDCTWFLGTGCTNPNCKFVHDQAKKDRLDAKKSCKYFARGFCGKGDKCSFNHDEGVPDIALGKLQV
jgi:hypothetical protein